ncbi:MAG: hypothetical protein AB7E32_03785 [Desulfovibrio sp.]
MNSADMINLTSQLAAPAFFDMLALAGLGALLPALVAEAAGLASGKIFADKFAQQMASLFTTFMAVSAIAFLGGAIILMRGLPWLREWLTSPQSPMLPALAAWGTALFFGGVYHFTFKPMRSNKAVHLLLGLLGALASLASIPLTLAASPALLGSFGSGKAPVMHPLVLPAPNSLLWPFALQFTLLSIGLAGGLGMAYLVYRRNRDDFGRDYYNYALPAAARWAAPFMLLQTAGMVWLLLMLPPDIRALLLGSSLAPLLYAGAALALACCALWTVVLRSRAPLRLKGLILTGAICAWGVHLAAVVLCFVLLPAV